jgi:hypothetical protein
MGANAKSDHVRPAVEALMANGITTWFAEFIEPQLWEDNDKSLRGDVIAAGTRGSSSAILFVNNVWESLATRAADEPVAYNDGRTPKSVISGQRTFPRILFLPDYVCAPHRNKPPGRGVPGTKKDPS